MLGSLPSAPSDGIAQQVRMSGHESRWHVHKSLDMNMYKYVKVSIQWVFHPWVWHDYLYVLVEFIVHDLWDMPVLAEHRLTTYVRVVGTKGKHVSNAWDGMHVWVVSGRWEWITWPCTHISAHAPLPAFCDCLNYVLNPILITISICKYSFEVCIVNISLVD